ncbi:class I SAM-dependent methyltransferase [Psychrobacillus sp. L4]|uniref:class I SAM-dependent methyltransferase n=1 Tax=Psychrobacillus sp. L4 TaxID=3236892 RepID=UPI0036F21A81
MNTKSLEKNKHSWEAAAERFYGRNPLPEYGPMAPLEDNLNLFGDITNLKVLDIGCGSGHSLQYMNQRNAAELWGLDLSEKQINSANLLLAGCGSPVQLFQLPMEVNPGLPHNYFDIVYSIYALGWTTDLDKTLSNINKYLKQGGLFIFSWEHPLHSRVSNEDGVLTFNKSYHEEGPYDHEGWGNPAIMQQFRISTYINTLINHGFQIEKVVEDVWCSEEDIKRHENRWYSYEKAKSIPTTLIIKCRKL